MKKIVMASAVMAATAMAGEIDSRPEASVRLSNAPNL